jgi:hypothetical protein
VVNDASTISAGGAAGDPADLPDAAGAGGAADPPDAHGSIESGTAPEAAAISDAPLQQPDVQTSADGSPTGGHLVINEVDYDQPGADNAEFVEIYNGTGAPVSLAAMTLVLVNGANNQDYMSIALAPAVSLADGQYLVVCTAAVSVAAGALTLVGIPNNGLQNGSPDGVALVDSAEHKVIDALSYAGSITAAKLTGVNGMVNLVEGTAVTVIDSATADGSLVRKPNGHDTDNASADWAFTPTPTPGAVNTP